MEIITSESLEYLVKHENENTHLDFKASEYSNQEALLKDVMSMANASFDKTSLIILGVKAQPGMSNVVVGLERIKDQAEIENIVQANIEPLINFSYTSFKYGEKLLGVLVISTCNNPPYMMKKDYQSLRTGDCWVRKGSKQSRATREDMDKLYAIRQNLLSTANIQFGFNDRFTDTVCYKIPDFSADSYPSAIQSKKLNDLLNMLRQKKSLKEDSPGESGLIKPSFQLIFKHFAASYGDYDSEKKAIVIGHSEFNTPIFCTEDELQERINNCQNSYYENDYYFFFEEMSMKQNFYILNNGSIFLEDVVVKLWFSKEVFIIADEKPEKPVPFSFFQSLEQQPQLRSMSGYPTVEEKQNDFVVEESHKQIRHKEITPIFTEELRIQFMKEKAGTFFIPYQISARNLPNPIQGKLLVKVTRETGE